MARGTLQWAALCWALVLAVPAQNGAAPGATVRPATASADTVVASIRNEFYEVHGVTGAEVRADMNSKKIGDYDAVTSWDIRWSFRPKKTADGYLLQDVRVNLECTMRLPSWSGAGASREDLADWNRYMEALMLHEKEHADNAMMISREIHDTLSSQTARATWNRAQIEGNKTGYLLLDKLRKLDADFDGRTGHGATQGAVFP